MESEGETGGKSLKNLGVQVCQICGDNVGTRAMESEGETGGKSLKNLGVQVCQICGDNVGTTAKGDPFVACDVCAFPVCRPCYEYERKDGNQCCPQCKTRYKRHKGSHSRAKQRERKIPCKTEREEEKNRRHFFSTTQKNRRHFFSIVADLSIVVYALFFFTFLFNAASI